MVAIFQKLPFSSLKLCTFLVLATVVQADDLCSNVTSLVIYPEWQDHLNNLCSRCSESRGAELCSNCITDSLVSDKLRSEDQLNIAADCMLSTECLGRPAENLQCVRAVASHPYFAVPGYKACLSCVHDHAVRNKSACHTCFDHEQEWSGVQTCISQLMNVVQMGYVAKHKNSTNSTADSSLTNSNPDDDTLAIASTADSVLNTTDTSTSNTTNLLSGTTDSNLHQSNDDTQPTFAQCSEAAKSSSSLQEACNTCSAALDERHCSQCVWLSQDSLLNIPDSRKQRTIAQQCMTCLAEEAAGGQQPTEQCLQCVPATKDFALKDKTAAMLTCTSCLRDFQGTDRSQCHQCFWNAPSGDLMWATRCAACLISKSNAGRAHEMYQCYSGAYTSNSN